MIIQSFAPIAAPDAEILILGSMPGIASLEANQYYAHPRNAFWGIMGKLYGAGIALPYDERQSVLKSRRVALWDVLQFCQREGSLDSNIKEEVPNDFARFFAAHPHIRRVGLNGGKAAKSFEKYARPYLPPSAIAVTLPSTSPAHAAKRFEQKCAEWRAGLVD